MRGEEGGGSKCADKGSQVSKALSVESLGSAIPRFKRTHLSPSLRIGWRGPIRLTLILHGHSIKSKWDHLYSFHSPYKLF